MAEPAQAAANEANGPTGASGGAQSNQKPIAGATGAIGSTGQNELAGSAGSPVVKPRKPKGSNLNPVYGMRTMKAYPIQEQELENLFGLGLLATIFFSGASLLFSIFLDVYINLSFTSNLPNSKEIIWDSVAWVSFILCFIFLGLGVIQIRVGKTKVNNIKKETNFGDQ
jgi:hypothetical protein